jgi:parallel beta-helix repeat protein
MEESMYTPHDNKKLLSSLVILSLGLLGLFTTPPQTARAGGPYIVDVSYDGPDSNLNDGSCYDGVSGCTLRAAIQQASYDGLATSITFDSSLAGITLYLSDSYGSLVVSGSSITIDGYTGPSNYPPIINGSNLTGSKNVFDIQGNYNTLQNLVVRDGPANGIYIYDTSASGYGSYNTLNHLFVYGNVNNGIAILGDSGGGGHDNAVQHSLIGAANWAQTTCPGDSNSWDGILIANGADYTYIDSNTIVCNGNSGIYLYGGTGGQISNTIIQTNKIGTDDVNDMGNGLSGIADWQAYNTTIFNNLISGNGNDGVWLDGSSGAVMTTNRIGVNQSGITALANDYSGVAISDGANGNTLGSPTDANARNIISGNSLCGVEFTAGAFNNLLDGNYIGLGGTGGMAVVPNGLAGVCFNNVGVSILSTGSATVHQYISGTTFEGVYATNSSNIYIGSMTLIGVAGDGSTPAGNGREGILLDEGTQNTIISSGKVMYNGLAGIAVVGNTSTGNDLGPYVVNSNVGLPLDLGNDGHTANGSQTPPGPNNWVNYPEVNMPGSGSFSGVACPGCVVRVYQSVGNPIANYGGGTFLALVNADATTGDFNYTFPPGVPAVTMVACTPISYDCSEMSPSVENTAAPLLKVFLPLARKP